MNNLSQNPEENSSLPAPDTSRRNFIQQAGRGLVAAGVAGTLGTIVPAEVAAQAAPSQTGPTDVTLPPLYAATEAKTSGPPNPQPPDQQVGYAVVGLGHLTLEEILPALEQCKKAKLVALVSGSPDKMQKIARQYSISPQNCYSYANYDQLKNNPAVEVIYIVLPNSMHAEYTIRGARAGKHILCEKPMATSVKECEQMIAACEKANKKLMIAYRIQYEPKNRAVQKLVRDKTYGQVKLVDMGNTQNVGDPTQWRLNKKLAGGGSLPDIGIYCLNTVRFLLGEEPTEVRATTYSTPGDPRFREVEEMASFQLQFPSGCVVKAVSSYGTYNTKRYRVYAEAGAIDMDPAFPYYGIQMQTFHAPDGTEKKEQPQIAEKNQFGAEMDHMAECVRQNKQPYTPGEEGLQDHRIMEAIYESARHGGKPVKLPAVAKLDAFRGSPPTQA